MTIAANRGRLIGLAPDEAGIVTIHPSFLLRLLPDRARQDAEFAAFVADLRLLRPFLADRAA
jgi:hypothetical protein